MSVAINAIIASEYNSTMDAVSWSLRSMICAPPGSRLLALDFANIEGRALAWLAGEGWKLQAFRDYDTFTGEIDAKGKPVRLGPDLYLVAAGKILGVPPDKVTKPQRQAVGKPAELGLGFGGGVGAFLTMLKNGSTPPWIRSKEDAPVKVTLDDVVAAVREAVPARVWAETEAYYGRGAIEAAHEQLEELRLLREQAAEEREALKDAATAGEELPTIDELARQIARKNRNGLTRDHWVALEISKTYWRQANMGIAMFWRQLEDAAIQAVEQPGTIVPANRYVSYSKRGDFLQCRLPSGRKLTYPYAHIVHPDAKSNRTSPRLVYEGLDSYTRKWGECQTYGGSLAENVTQAVARDVLRDSILRLRKHGYRIVLHVHDEIVCEMPNGKGSLEEMSAIMSQLEPWAAGMPIAVDGYEGKRYRK
jgi:DNA polymerase bacteriophage-type